MHPKIAGAGESQVFLRSEMFTEILNEFAFQSKLKQNRWEMACVCWNNSSQHLTRLYTSDPIDFTVLFFISSARVRSLRRRIRCCRAEDKDTHTRRRGKVEGIVLAVRALLTASGLNCDHAKPTLCPTVSDIAENGLCLYPGVVETVF